MNLIDYDNAFRTDDSSIFSLNAILVFTDEDVILSLRKSRSISMHENKVIRHATRQTLQNVGGK